MPMLVLGIEDDGAEVLRGVRAYSHEVNSRLERPAMLNVSASVTTAG
jgi:hypothetical protein